MAPKGRSAPPHREPPRAGAIPSGDTHRPDPRQPHTPSTQVSLHSGSQPQGRSNALPSRRRSVVPLDAARFNPRKPTSSDQSRPASQRSRSEGPPRRTRNHTVPLPASRSTATAEGRKLQAKPAQKKSLPIAAFIQGARLVILGVGVWAIAGTILSMWSPSARSDQSSQATPENSAEAAAQVQSLHSPSTASLFANLSASGQELTELAARITPVTTAVPDLTTGIFLVDLDNGDFVSLNGEASLAAASLIKIPILVAFFQDVDAGKIQLNETLTMQEGDIASGSGEMQFHGVGTQYTALETATNMIVISDNTATNMLIRRLGGQDALNRRFQEWGLQQTVLNAVLPDLEGTNTTSAKELSGLLARVSAGELVSMKSRDRLLEIMEQTVNNTLLPAGLGPGATISHKTGDIGSLAGDSGLVDLPNGKRYAITVMVKRPHNDPRAYDLIVRLSGVAYEYFAPSTAPASGTPDAAGTVSPPATTPAAEPVAPDAVPPSSVPPSSTVPPTDSVAPAPGTTPPAPTNTP